MARTHGTTDWDAIRDRALEVYLEEIANRGVRGSPGRTCRRLNQELGLGLSVNAFRQGMARVVTNLQELQADAERAYERKTAGEENVHVEIKSAPLPSEHPMLVELRSRLRSKEKMITELRGEIRTLQEQRTITGELRALLEEELIPIEYGQGVPILEQGEEQDAVDAVLVLSDEHADHVISPEVTHGLEDYDFNIFRARLQRLTEIVRDFATVHLPRYHFERLWIMSLGDKLQGAIHEMKLRNHFQNCMRATAAIIDAEAEMIATLEPHFSKGVHLVGVSGNHPRQTRKPQHEDPHDNLDFLIGCGIAERLHDHVRAGRVSVTLPRAWTAFVDVRGWRFALNHGDQVRGFAGFPWYGYDRLEGRVRALHALASGGDDIDYFLYGHFHTNVTRTGPDSKSIHNGAFFMTDPYALKQLAVGSRPQQQFLVFKDKEEDRGHILEIPIYLRDRQRERAIRDGEWEPDLGRDTVLEMVAGGWHPGEFPLVRAAD